MTSKARYAARYARAAPAVLMPPNLQEMGSLAFTASGFAELDAWLAEEGWPAEHMDAAMLEGYLVALLVWPIELAAGAWLPAIWGIRGWKVAAKIATSESYYRFLTLVIGFLQDLERRLTASPPLRPFVLAHCGPILSARYFAGAAWATGFMVALRDNSAGLSSRSASARSAVEGIARFASLRSTKSIEMASASEELGAWVARLMEERPLRDERGSFSLGLSRAAEGGRPRHGATRKECQTLASGLHNGNRKAVDTSPLSPYLVPASGACP